MTETKPPEQSGESANLIMEMIRLEHQRWNHWTLAFFSAITAVFVIWKQIEAKVEMWIPSTICVAVSVAWVCSALAIRRSTAACWQAASDIEDPKILATPFVTMKSYQKDHKHWLDFLECLVPCRDSSGHQPFCSVGRNLVRAGVVSAVVFTCLAVYDVKTLRDFVSAHAICLGSIAALLVPVAVGLACRCIGCYRIDEDADQTESQP